MASCLEKVYAVITYKINYAILLSEAP